MLGRKGRVIDDIEKGDAADQAAVEAEENEVLALSDRYKKLREDSTFQLLQNRIKEDAQAKVGAHFKRLGPPAAKTTIDTIVGENAIMAYDGGFIAGADLTESIIENIIKQADEILANRNNEQKQNIN